MEHMQGNIAELNKEMTHLASTEEKMAGSQEPAISKVPKEELHWYENKEYNDGLHFTPEKALKEPFEYALINGGRSNGKTTGWQLQMVDEFFNYGAVFGKIIRKYEYDRSKALKWFDNLVVKYIKEVWHHELIYEGTNFYLIAEEGEPDRYLPLEKGKRKQPLNLKLFVETFNLNFEVDAKSHDFSYIKRLFFEEYTLINQYDYLPNEVEHFASLVSTINREREDLSVVFIGNTISKHNPYFDWLGINVNKIKLKAGQSKRFTLGGFDRGARIYVEFVPTVYGKDKKKVPRILEVGNNEIAITGDWVISDYVFDEDFDGFINKTDFRYNFSLRSNNRIYYHCTANYKNTTFNFITSRLTNMKSNGLIYDLDLIAVERIKSGTMGKKQLFEILKEIVDYETLYSDDEIEYKYTKLLKGGFGNVKRSL